MKRILLVFTCLVAAGIADAQNVPSGLTGLWRFQSDPAKYSATIGGDLTSTSGNAWFLVPYTSFEPGLSDQGGIQTLQYNYLTVPDGIAPNGGGSYVNQYTVSIDYRQTSLVGLSGGWYYNSLFQTATGNGNDGDIFIATPNQDFSGSVIGVGATGYSTLTFNSGQWHRITWSVDNGNFYRIYIDGSLYLDAPGQPIDGRFSLDPTFLLFADNDGEDAWGIIGNAMIWDHALTTDEIAGMGGWLDGSATPTPLIIPEPSTLLLAGLAGLICLFKRVRK